MGRKIELSTYVFGFYGNYEMIFARIKVSASSYENCPLTQ